MGKQISALMVLFTKALSVTVTAFFIATVAPAKASAAISGYSTSVLEIQAVVSSEYVEQALGSAYRIESIVGTPIGGTWGANYEITAKINTGEKCTLKVEVTYVTNSARPQDWPQMQLKIGARVCK